MNKRITMQDIADHLHISKNSVSQALSGKPGVSEETRRSVSDTADKLGYIYAPRQSNKNRVNSIALIASDFAFSQTFFGEIYLSVQKRVKEMGMNLLLESISPKEASDLSLPLFIQDNSVQGIIILSHINNDYINRVISTGIPTILIDHHHPHIQADAILSNNRFGAYLAVEHLIKKNHKDIAFIGNTSFSPSYYERLQGYNMAHEDYQLSIQKKFILRDAPDDKQIVKQFIDNLSELPTAWFCINDELGYIVYTLLKEKGYLVPENASIFSFDNGQLSQLTSPRTATMDIDLSTYGEQAVDLLLWRISHPSEPIQEISFLPQLIEGQSVGWNK